MQKTLFITVILFLLIMSIPAGAQQKKGEHTLYGAVKVEGAPLSGVEIVIIGEATKVSKSTFTDEHGVYSIPGLPVDEYLIRATPQPLGIYTDGEANALILFGKDKEVNFNLRKK